MTKMITIRPAPGGTWIPDGSWLLTIGGDDTFVAATLTWEELVRLKGEAESAYKRRVGPRRRKASGPTVNGG